MLRRKARRPYQLVSVDIPGSVLYVFTGLRDGGASRPHARTRARGRGYTPPGLRQDVETAGVSLLAALATVLTALLREVEP